MRYTRQNFTEALLALLPSGAVWPREPDSTLVRVVSALAPAFERSGDRAEQVLVDGFPASTVELLGEWEGTVGLPDPCIGVQTNLVDRRNAVVGRLRAVGGQSCGYLQAVLAAYGITAAVSNGTAYPFRAGISSAGDAVCEDGYAHTVFVSVSNIQPSFFAAALSAAGDPLASYGNSGVINCVLKRIAPAHTQFLISFV